VGIQIGNLKQSDVKTALCDFDPRCTPNPHERIGGSKRKGKEANPIEAVGTARVRKPHE